MLVPKRGHCSKHNRPGVFKMKMISITLVFLISSLSAWSCDSLEFHKISGDLVKICYLKKYNAFMSESCSKGKCKAIEIIKKSRAATIKKELLSGSFTPGTIQCTYFGEEIWILKDDTDSEAAFCRALDGSLVDVFSLSLK